MNKIILMILMLCFQQTVVAQFPLKADSQYVVFDSEVVDLQFDETYYLSEISLSELDTNNLLLNRFINLLPTKANFLIVIYVKGVINEKCSISPFTVMSKQLAQYIIRKKKLAATQFIFPEFYTERLDINSSYQLERGLYIELVYLD